MPYITKKNSKNKKTINICCLCKNYKYFFYYKFVKSTKQLSAWFVLFDSYSLLFKMFLKIQYK